MAKVTLVILDLDGTLHDSARFRKIANERAISAMIKAGLHASPDRIRRALESAYKMNPNSAHHFQETLQALNVPFDPRVIAAGIGAFHYAKHDARVFKPFADSTAFIRFLKSKKLNVVIATIGYPIKQWDKILRLGLGNFFDRDQVFVTGSITTKGIKRAKQKNAQFYGHILRKMQARPNETVVVGDHEPMDIAPAAALGINTIRIKRGKYANEPSNADFIVNNFSEAREAIKELLAR